MASPGYVQQPPGYAQQPPVIAYAQPAAVAIPQTIVATQGENPAVRYKSTFKAIGITQIVIGVICIVISFALLGIMTIFYAGTGFWGGAWYIISGSLGVASGVNPNSCNVIAGLVISILASIISFVATIIDGLAATTFGLVGATALIVMHALLALMGFAEFVVSIVHSAFCCKAGCGRTNYQGQVVATATITTVPMQTVQVPSYQVHRI